MDPEFRSLAAREVGSFQSEPRNINNSWQTERLDSCIWGAAKEIFFDLNNTFRIFRLGASGRMCCIRFRRPMSVTCRTRTYTFLHFENVIQSCDRMLERNYCNAALYLLAQSGCRQSDDLRSECCDVIFSLDFVFFSPFVCFLHPTATMNSNMCESVNLCIANEVNFSGAHFG